MGRPAGIYAAMACLASLSGCSSPVEQAQEQYDMVKRARGSADDICAHGKTLLEARLAAGDEDEYRSAKVRTYLDCTQARYDERDGIVRDPGGNVIAPDDLEERNQ